jgi:release factor glutamine methyltransferase
VTVPTVGEIVKKTTDFFLAKGDETSQTARLDSELLIGRALGLERLQVFLKHDQALTEEQLEKCRALVRRRSKGEPVAYILGEKGFYKHSFEVTSATLIPRPETEMLVVRGLEILEPKLAPRGARAKSSIQLEIAAAAERREEAERTAALAEATHLGLDSDEINHAIESANEFTRDRAVGNSDSISTPRADLSARARPLVTIIDLGCGSGCIGLSIADEIKDRAAIRLIFVDNSTAAMEVAKRNAAKLGLAEMSEFIVGDAGDPSVLAGLEGEVDLIVANPPYIDPSDTRIQETVKQFEPHGALFAGEAGADGIAEIQRWSIVAKKLARTGGGEALFEIGDGQGPASMEIFKAAGWDHVKLARDLSNRERMIEVRI